MKIVVSVREGNMGRDVTNQDDAESDFIDSPLSQTVTRNGVEVRVEIFGNSHPPTSE